jgi:chloramphenicol-sensitive protein RarD
MSDPRREYRLGLIQAFSAYAFWGLIPFYFKLLGHVSPLEVVANRIIWSLFLVVAILIARGQLSQFLAVFTMPRTLGALTASAVFIAGNWLVYIWAVTHDHVLAASLGYFLNPLVNVLLGVTLLKERLVRVQWIAILLAAVGVAVLAAGSPQTLWISLALAISFAFYGLVRKLAPAGSLVGLSVETFVLFLPACATLFWVHGEGRLAFGHEAWTTILLLASGAITSIPLLMFASGARRLPMVTLGLLQYVSPTIQFVLALFVFGEKLTPDRWASFALIWLGLGVFAAHALMIRRKAAPALA